MNKAFARKNLCRIVLPCLIFCPILPLKAQGGIRGPADPYGVDTLGPRSIPGMSLVWHDEFDGEGRPDPGNWGFEHGFVRNRELQWYQPQNASCREGLLVIEGRRERLENPAYDPRSGDWRRNRPHADYTSACLLTKGLQEWSGRVYFEIRARIDTTAGAWPAIWLLGSEGRWPVCGEIDIMEFYRINGLPTILANVAWQSSTPYRPEWDSRRIPLDGFLSKDPDWADKFHVWSMQRDEKAIKLYLDGELLNETLLKDTVNPDGSNPFSIRNKLYLLVNLALGSNGGNPSLEGFPISFEVDYVRVYRED